MKILELLGLKYLQISSDHNIPFRASLYSIEKLVRKLEMSDIHFSFGDERYKKNELPCEKHELERLMRNNMFYDRHKCDYESYKHFIFISEIKKLLHNFRMGTRFTLIACKEKYSNLLEAVFTSHNFTLQYADGFNFESINKIACDTDVFVTYDKERFKAVFENVMSVQPKGICVFDIEQYMFSHESAETFMLKHIEPSHLIEK